MIDIIYYRQYLPILSLFFLSTTCTLEVQVLPHEVIGDGNMKLISKTFKQHFNDK